MFATILPIVIANLPAIVKLGESGINFILNLRRAAIQTGEWTAEAEAAFQSDLMQDALAPEWQPDPKS